MELFEKVFGDIIPKNPIKTGQNIMINCPWHNDNNASLSISTNAAKPVYNCFGCGKKGSLIGAFMERNNVNYTTALKMLELDVKHEKMEVEKVEKHRIDTDYSNYCYNCWNNTLMDDNLFAFYGKKLYDLRGITLPTAVCCLIGFDKQKGWIFPVVRYSDKKIVGYEIREKNFKHFTFKNGKDTKCYKAENTPSCLCWIFEAQTNKKAIICEGFIDSFFMFQYQHEKLQKKYGELAKVDCNILTSSCGVKHLPELVEKAELWNDFDEIIFCLDNDEAGNIATEKLMEMQHDSKFKFFTGLNAGEDFEEFYKRKLLNELASV